MEPATDLVVDSAARHLRQRVTNHLGHRLVAVGRMHAKKQREHERVGKFRRLPESAVDTVVMRRERTRRFCRESRLQVAAGRHVIRQRAQRLGQLLEIVGDFLRLVAIRLRHGGEDAWESWHPLPILRRVIGPAEKWPPVRREEHRQRPTAAPRDELHRIHVNLIEVGTLFAIDFDRNEVLVNQPRDRVVLERLALHHVAPMAGRVADRQHDRLVLRLRAPQRVRSPRIPIDGIVRMLAQVRTLFVD